MASKKILSVSLVGLLLAVAAVFVKAGGIDSEQTDTRLIYKQWQKSGHANSMNTAEEKKSMNKPGCAKCHTAEGYWQVILAGKPSTAPYEKVSGLSCLTCHYSAEGSQRIGALRVKRVKDACSGCHSLLVANTATNLSWCPQASMVKGIGAKGFPTSQYQNGSHSQLQKNCVTCHMAAAGKNSDKGVGGHSFRVITKGKAIPAFNANACLQCHEDISLNRIRQQQGKFKKLLRRLAALLPANTSESKKAGQRVPKFPTDPVLNSIEARASYNYHMVAKDGTFGIHNPPYVRSLLLASIEALIKQKKKDL